MLRQGKSHPLFTEAPPGWQLLPELNLSPERCCFPCPHPRSLHHFSLHTPLPSPAGVLSLKSLCAVHVPGGADGPLKHRRLALNLPLPVVGWGSGSFIFTENTAECWVLCWELGIK